MPEQLPATQHTVGGQATVTNWDVISQEDGFQEDSENTQNANGTHRCKITYSRRKTKSLELQGQSTADPTAFSDGGEYTLDTVDYTIESATARKTRGPIMVNVDLLSQVDDIT